MPIKRLHILANSVKNGQHCVAGREVLLRDNALAFGEWVRPISRHGNGELHDDDCRLDDGASPRIFDVVDVPVEEHAGSRHQPENWFIEANARWRKVLLNEKLPDPIVEKPLHLWISAGEQPDRISSVALRVRATQRSLYLIAVKEFQIELGWREHEGELKRRRRAKFLYDRRHYDFSLTDPIIQERYCRSFPKPEEGPRIVRLPCDECLLCVSLTPEFHGYHYKIVATVIEQ